MPKVFKRRLKNEFMIYMADTKEDAIKAYELFLKTYEGKYPKATDGLLKDKDSMLAFYDFPVEH